MFLLGTKTKLMDGAGAGSAPSGGLALIESGEQPAFLKAVEKNSSNAVPLEEIDGTNYSNGRKLRMILYRVARAP